MAKENLMERLPEGIKRVSKPGGPFLIRDNRGSHSVVVLTEVLVTCGGINSEKRAVKLARSLNRCWHKKIEADSKSWQKMLEHKK